MPNLSISQLSAFTGKDRRTVTARLANLDFLEGEDNAHLYESTEALAAIYAAGKSTSLDDAKRDQALEAAALSRARREEIQRTRIPISIVTAIWDTALQGFAATLKAANGSELTTEKTNELLSALREVKLPSTW